jgi:RNA recognition motif-containing protein
MVEEDIRDLFKEYGHIEELSILKENGKSKGKLCNNFKQ